APALGQEHRARRDLHDAADLNVPHRDVVRERGGRDGDAAGFEPCRGRAGAVDRIDHQDIADVRRGGDDEPAVPGVVRAVRRVLPRRSPSRTRSPGLRAAIRSPTSLELRTARPSIETIASPSVGIPGTPSKVILWLPAVRPARFDGPSAATFTTSAPRPT